MTRAVIVNDDGVHARGIRQLALAAIEAGLEITVAAPESESSGASGSLTAVNAEGNVVVEPTAIEGVDAPVWAVRASPAFIALLAVRGAFGPPPDFVLSGINHGPNTGHAILHSGTVGAALTAATHGCRGMAFSMAAPIPSQWETASAVVRAMTPRIDCVPSGLVLNVNIPNVPPDRLRGIRRARLSSFGAVQTNVGQVGQGFVQVTFADIHADLEPGTDAAFLAGGYATVTPLVPICEAPHVDLPGLSDEELSELATVG